jgi:predicted metal-dependent phosphotriesterase family hydrolase
MTSIIRTVTGDISPQDLGVCYPHEHLLCRPPAHLGEPELNLQFDSLPAASQELDWFKGAGGQAILEMSTPDFGRNADGLRRLSETTGIHIVAVTGFNKEIYSKPWLEKNSVKELADLFVKEVNQGMDGIDIRAGAIKAASSLNAISPLTRKMFRAAARAHHATGAPITTHTEAGTMAMEQVELLTSEGVSPSHVIIGHLDRNLDWEIHRKIAQTGVYLGFDQIGKEKYYPDSLRIEFILRLVAEGHGKQILLSGDQAKRSCWPSYDTGGGPGLTYILWRFLPWLREKGLAEEAVQDLVIHNPARALAIEI